MADEYNYGCTGDRCEDDSVIVDLNDPFGILFEATDHFYRYECVGQELADDGLRDFGYKYNAEESYPKGIYYDWQGWTSVKFDFFSFLNSFGKWKKKWGFWHVPAKRSFKNLCVSVKTLKRLDLKLWKIFFL